MASRALSNLGLNLGWTLGEDGWKAGADFNWLAIDTLLQGRVISVGLNTPPASPTEGECYIVGTAPTGVWSTFANRIVIRDAGVWTSIVPLEGWKMYDRATDVDYRFNGTVWRQVNQLVSSEISGLKLVWGGPTTLTVYSGAAGLANGDQVHAPVDITKSSLVLANNTWYHVYLWVNAGAADVELSTTAPSVPYKGTARSKTSDDTRRYLGSVRSNGSAQLLSFVQVGNKINYQERTNTSPFRILNNGTATAETTVSAAAVVPVSSRVAQLGVINVSTDNGAVWLNNSEAPPAGPPTSAISGLAANSIGLSTAYIDFPLDASQTLTYWNQLAPSGAAAYIDVLGYYFDR